MCCVEWKVAFNFPLISSCSILLPRCAAIYGVECIVQTYSQLSGVTSSVCRMQMSWMPLLLNHSKQSCPSVELIPYKQMRLCFAIVELCIHCICGSAFPEVQGTLHMS